MTEKMIDDVFEKPELAELYDLFNPWMACDDFYLFRAIASGGPVLDVGCGTGMLAAAIAAHGLEVVGVDPATGMLEVARNRAGAEAVSWIQSRGQALRLQRKFAFAYMTGHAFQAVLSDAAAVALMRTVGRHLLPDGRFVIETRNARNRAWEHWHGDSRVVDDERWGRVEEWSGIEYQPETGIVALDTRFHFLDKGGERRGSSKIRFIDFDQLAGLVDAAGLKIIELYGDWDASAFDNKNSREIIAVIGT